MKEIEKLSIGGYAFTFEKDAAAEVAQYLKGLEAHYMGQQGGKEIMEGIEERMAELLLDRCGTNGVVMMADVQGVIDILGRPERIEADDPEPGNPQEKARKKLFRDMENKRIAGVCAGLGNYFDFDVVLMRVLFAAVTLILFFTGARHGVWSMFGFVAYAVLWLAMPAARTARDRWAMKGDGSTLDDIQRSVRSGVREMGDAARRGVREVGDAVRSPKGSEVGKILLLIIGVGLLLSGVSGLASVSALGLLNSNGVISVPVDHLLDRIRVDWPIFYDYLSTPWVLVLSIAAVILPLIWLIYLGVRFIFGLKAPSWKPGLILFVLWLVVLVVLLVLGVFGTVATEMKIV